MKRWIHASTDREYLIVNDPDRDREVSRAKLLTDENEIRRLVQRCIELYKQNVAVEDRYGDDYVYWNLVHALRNEHTPSDCISLIFNEGPDDIQLSDFTDNPNCNEDILYKAAKKATDLYLSGKRNMVNLTYPYKIIDNPDISFRVAKEIARSGNQDWIRALMRSNNDDVAHVGKFALDDIDNDAAEIEPELNIDFYKKVPLSDKWLNWAGTSDRNEAVEVLEDNGYAVADSLGEACELYYNNNQSVDDVLNALDSDWGNSVGVIPLADYSWNEQQEIYLQWLGKYHPDEISE